MQHFPKDIKFCFPWRPYQKRILDAAERYVHDWHFHVVAAPGSGKTVLGLELVLRLDRPTVVFAPSLGIRDQWVRRFCDLFLGQHAPPDWISTDLEYPGLLTIITYQSLGSLMKKESEQLVLDRLRSASVETLVFDEAHHLRNYWWKCLMAIKTGLERPVTISLTATPPYDVTQVEWNRYMVLCGEVDEEISAAELVREGNLCPHQDYIYFCRPSQAERQEVMQFHGRVEGFLKDLALDEELIAALHTWPPMVASATSVEELTRHNEFALSVAVFLRFAHGVVPEEFLETMGLDGVELPELNASWAEVLLNGLIYHVDFFGETNAELTRRLRLTLSSFGAVHKRRVLLRTTPHHAKVLRSSLTKLESISELVDVEHWALKESLRMVILTDYICDHDFPTAAQPDLEISRVGVVPIFEYLRKLRKPGIALGVLTGKLVVLPAAIAPLLDDLARQKEIDLSDIVREPLWHDTAYIKIAIKGKDTSRLVELITDLFLAGEIHVLTGTTALLGEGWDAPAINSLVLATVVGSYVSTNQIRGRAIRVCTDDPDKTANIWHLACAYNHRMEGLNEEVSPRMMDDIDLLTRRFDTFTGLDVCRLAIENGLGRMGLSAYDLRLLDLHAWNARTVSASQDRFKMAKRWQTVFDHLESLPGTRIYRPAEEILVPKTRVPARRITHLLLSPRMRFTDWLRDAMQVRKVQRTAGMLYDVLSEQGLVAEGGAVEVTRGSRDVLARLRNVSRRDEAVFTAALAEIYNPLQKPRYLISMGRESYAVPQLLATNKTLAQKFHKGWRKHVGRGKLVYTFSEEGRVLLLQARQKFLATRYHDIVRSRKVVS